MRYVCLIYDDEKKLGTMSGEEANSFMGAYFQFTEEVKRNGNYVAGEALQPVRSATSLRHLAGKLSTTDGPFMETKEHLGGFYLIEARDLNEAIQVASRIPSAPIGTVEVRPCRDLEVDGVPHPASRKPR